MSRVRQAKDAAVYLVIALTLRGSTAKLGATQTNQLVNLGDFFTASVLPELQAGSAGGNGGHPILLADAIKFVTVFRGQLPAETYSVVMPLLATMLNHKVLVVHTYAATAIERMLAYREPLPAGAPPGSAAPLRFGTAALAPLLQVRCPPPPSPPLPTLPYPPYPSTLLRSDPPALTRPHRDPRSRCSRASLAPSSSRARRRTPTSCGPSYGWLSSVATRWDRT